MRTFDCEWALFGMRLRHDLHATLHCKHSLRTRVCLGAGGGQVKSLEEAHATCGDDLAARNYSIQQLEVKLETRDAELAALKAAHDSLSAEHAAGSAIRAEQAREIEQLTGKLETYNTYTRELTGAQQQLAADSSARHQTDAAIIHALEKTVEELRQMHAPCEKLVAGLRGELAAREEDVRALNQEVSALNSMFVERDGRIGALQRQVRR